ncbi:MAG: hypothetical protein AB7O04_01730 [Hyphomonadaceae bacterium]
MAIPDAGAARAGAAAFTLPYVEFSHALMRAHLDAHAMTAANRALAAAMRDILRRQMTLALELAESTLQSAAGRPSEAPAGQAGDMYDRAAAAVREIGEAVIEAQLTALRTLQIEADAAAQPAKPPARGFSRASEAVTSGLSPGG